MSGSTTKVADEAVTLLHDNTQQQTGLEVAEFLADIEPPSDLFETQHVQLEVDTTMTLAMLVSSDTSYVCSFQ